MGNRNSSPHISYNEAELRFSTVELNALELGFSRMCRLNPRGSIGEIDYSTYRRMLLSDFPEFPEILAKRMFETWDLNANGGIDFSEFICGICVISRGKLEERLRFLFYLYDINGDGVLIKRDLEDICKQMYDRRFSLHERSLSQALIEEVFKVKNDGKLNKDEIGASDFESIVRRYLDAPLIQWTNSVGQNMLRPLFGDSIQPENKLIHQRSRHMSGRDLAEPVSPNLVKSPRKPPPTDSDQLPPNEQERVDFMSVFIEPKAQNLIKGDSWYLLSSSWFSKWCEYSGCRILSKVQSEQDESTSDDSVPKEKLPPPPIDNHDIIYGNGIVCINKRNSPSNGSENYYCLLPNMRFEKEYYVLNSAAWNFLFERYGGGPTLPRMVIEKPGYGIELELTPLVLHVRGVCFEDTDNTSLASEFHKIVGANSTGCMNIVASKHTSIAELRKWIVAACFEGALTGVEIDLDDKSKTGKLSRLTRMKTGARIFVNGLPYSMEDTRFWCVVGHDDFDLVVGNLGSKETSNVNSQPDVTVSAVEQRNQGFSQQTMTLELLPSGSQTVEDANLQDGQVVVLEVRRSDRSWPFTKNIPTSSLQPDAISHVIRVEVDPSKYHDQPRVVILGSRLAEREYESTFSIPSSISARSAAAPATVGLCNLGNTCFMSAALQCLFHTPVFKDYFLYKLYMRDINTTSKFGTHGALTQSFADLMMSVWTDKSDLGPRWIAPRRFKQEMGNFDSRFYGYDQQDSQELLSSLLDGIAEDLNRIRKKAYVEVKDSDGRSDEDVAREWWENHLMRELSIVTAVFAGQYKSLITCETCAYESARFEPFLCLSLPLPEPKTRVLLVTLRFLDLKIAPVICELVVNMTDTFGRIARMLVDLQPGGDMCDVTPLHDSDAIVFATVSNNRLIEIFDVEQRVGDIPKGTQLHAFQVQSVVPLEDDLIKVGGQVVFAQDETLSMRATVTSIGDDGSDTATIRVASDANHTNASNMRHGSFRKITVPRSRLRVDSCAEPIRLVLEQRQWVSTKSYFLNPYQQYRFGSPIVLRVDAQSMTRAGLYRLVESQICVSSAPALDRDLTTDHDIVQHFGFTLVQVLGSNGSCAQCTWMKPCFGCALPCDDTLLSLLTFEDHGKLAVDWGFMNTAPPQLVDNREKAPKRWVSEMMQKANKAISVPLRELLLDFETEEKLAGMNEVYCGHCKQFRDHTKKIDLWRLPPVLVIHLKRFQTVSSERTKLDSLVEFPITNADFAPYLAKRAQLKEKRRKSEENKSNPGTATQDMDPVLQSQIKMVKSMMDSNSLGLRYYGGPDHGDVSTTYNLYGVVDHSGNLGTGHYVAKVKNAVDGKWYLCDDQAVSLLDTSKIVSRNAYMLFYLRSDIGVHGFLKRVYPCDEVTTKVNKVRYHLGATAGRNAFLPPASQDGCTLQ